MLKMKKNNLIEIQTAYSEIFISAVKFFESAGVIFTDSRRDHRHGLCILIDDSLATPVCINAFMFAMSRNALAGFYAHIIKGEKIGGPRRIQSLIKVINGLIKEGYSKGHQISHNLETGKYRLKGTEVLGIAMDIFERAFTYSLGGDTLRHMGDIYSLLGGETGTKAFFKEVMLATEASIPELEDETVHHPICGIPQIKCYTCKYCRCDEDGMRTCTKVSTLVSASRYEAHPGRYTDAHHSDYCGGLVSAVIDDRMDTCDDYCPRIK